ncbi:metal-dependent hydrolase [Candidatus Bathyarchaeota archaeon]|nr:metal-dependent hydrolase [Candidatus Bathyarchaeota archaeon]
MPITPFHYPVAYILYKLGGTLSLPALIVGSMLPDLEIPFIVLLFGTSVPHHLLLHSLIGALTLGTALAITITVFIYPRLTSVIFPVNKLKVKEKCQFSIGLVFSCALGCLSHVLLDVTNHAYNPLFWPFIAPNETPSPVVPFLGGVETASLLIHAVMIILFIGLFATKRENFWEHLLVE